MNWIMKTDQFINAEGRNQGVTFYGNSNKKRK